METYCCCQRETPFSFYTHGLETYAGPCTYTVLHCLLCCLKSKAAEEVENMNRRMNLTFYPCTRCGVVHSSRGADSTRLSDPYPPLYSQTVNYYCPLHNYTAKCESLQPCMHLSGRQRCQSRVMQSVYALSFLGREDVCLRATLCGIRFPNQAAAAREHRVVRRRKGGQRGEGLKE